MVNFVKGVHEIYALIDIQLMTCYSVKICMYYLESIKVKEFGNIR